MESYSILASHYNKFTQKDCDYIRWSQYLYGKVKPFGTRGVDLACGTGKMTGLMKKLGFDIVGIDNSRQMLSVAGQSVNACFIEQDMREFVLPRPVNFALCVNDGVNYLKPNELEQFFTRVCNALANSGVFVFDISSQYKLTNVVGNNVFYIDEDNVTLLWTNKLFDGKVEMNITLFEKQGKLYSRSDETHTQYIHNTNDIVSILQCVGFAVETTANYGETLTNESQRITFVATKNV